MRAGQFSINKTLVRASHSESGSFKFLADEMAKVGLGSIEFRGVPDELEVKRFAYAFAKIINDDVVEARLLETTNRQSLSAPREGT